MSERPPDRATWFRFYGQRYLMSGSLRVECLPDERAVWLDFLCLANMGGGRFDSADRNALAVQLIIPRELLDRAVKKFTAAGRLKISYDKRERKEIFIIVKWGFYQQTARPHRAKGGAHLPPLSSPSSKKRNKEREKEREREGSISAPQFAPKGSKSGADFAPLPPIPEDFSYAEKKILRDLKARVRELERACPDMKKLLEKGYNEKEVENYVRLWREKCAKARAEYIEAIKDRQ